MILEQIAEDTRIRVREQKQKNSLEEMRRSAEGMRTDTGFPFQKALEKPGISFICEVKKASPSKGIIAQEFPYLEIAEAYEAAGARAISCLTEPKYFLGKDAYLKEIAGRVSLPVLRKDFTIDAYQIYEAKTLGASAVLLICSLLEEAVLREYLEIAESLGLSALVEAHEEQEIAAAVRAGAKILGVNNRNLKDFSVHMDNSLHLRSLVPEDMLFVAESGIQGREDIQKLEEGNVDAVLIGELLMRSPDKSAALARLRGTGV